MPELRPSIVIPAFNEAKNLSRVLPAVDVAGAAAFAAEVVVVDGGSTDGTRDLARTHGARVIEVERERAAGNPALLRNRGAAEASGDLLVFLDADCEPQPGWLEAHIGAHRAGHRAVGGAFDLPPGLPPTARCDYYAGWYHMHPARPAGPVVSAPPGNFSIRADLFHEHGGFDARPGIAYSHEELRLQGRLQRAGLDLHFEPTATVLHHNRPGLANLLRRHYRWGRGAIESKAGSGAARFAGLYRHPWLLRVLALPLAVPLAAYVVASWARHGVYEPVVWSPAIFAGRVAYAFGMMSPAAAKEKEPYPTAVGT